MAIFGRFTERAQRVMNAARQAAMDMRQPYMGSEHLLLGLLKEDEHIPEEIASRSPLTGCWKCWVPMVMTA